LFRFVFEIEICVNVRAVGNSVRCFRALQHVHASLSEVEPIDFEGHILAALWYGTFDQDAQAPQKAQKLTARVFDSSPHLQHRKPAATAYPFDFTSNLLSKYSAPSFSMSADVRSALGLSGIKKSTSNGNAPLMSLSTSQQSRQNEQFQKFCQQRRAESRSSAESEPFLAKSDAALVTSSDAVMLGSLLSDFRRNSIISHDNHVFSDALAATLNLHSHENHHVNLNRTSAPSAVLEFYINSLSCLAHQVCIVRVCFSIVAYYSFVVNSISLVRLAAFAYRQDIISLRATLCCELLTQC
jgi:hypothetical protein